MWKCHKCGKPVYFAERKQSLGYDWHPECLRCEECGKRLNPGQHAEHKGVPYCHVPCYGALFGPQLFGHGTRVESHKNFGQKGIQRVNGAGPALPRDHLESKLKLYNEFYDNKSLKVRSREVNNRLILEGALRVYWGVQNVIHLKEDDDQRTLAIRKRNSARYSTSAIEQDNSDKENDVDASDSIEPPTTTTTTGPLDDFSTDISLSESMTFDSCSLNDYPLSEDATTPTTPTASSQSTTTANTGSSASTLPSKLDKLNNLEWDEIDDLLQVERRYSEKDKIYETMPVKLPSSQSSSESSPTKSASDKSNSTTTETSSDNFITASASLATTTTTTSTNATTTDDDETLKPMDYEEFKRSIHQEYVNGTNDLPEIDENTLKKNQPIDPSRINDSLKLYGENAMSKSFNCEQALRTIDPAMINDTLCRRALSGIEHSSARNYALQKSGSANLNHNHQGRSLFEKGINRSKSGPTCFEFTDSEEESTSTLKPGKPSTIRRNEPRYVNIRMNCYASSNDNDTSAGKGGGDTNSSSIAGELTVTETYVNGQQLHITEDGVVLRRPPRTGSTAIKRRSGNKRSRTKLKRRCSINGHFYNRETSFFTPPYGSQMSVWVTSLVTTQEVINLILEKYRVDSPAENFSLFILRDNGEQKRLKELDYPLLVRIMLGPHEDVARLFLMDAQKTQEISNEVAQFINLSIPECRAILDRYNDELEREVAKVREKYAELRRRIVNRMESLKIQYKNPGVQVIIFKKMTPSPFVRCYYEDGRDILVDIDSRNREEILEHLTQVVGKSHEQLDAEARLAGSKDNPTNFGVGCDRHCICEIPARIPCSGTIPMPKHVRDKHILAQNNSFYSPTLTLQ